MIQQRGFKNVKTNAGEARASAVLWAASPSASKIKFPKGARKPLMNSTG